MAYRGTIYNDESDADDEYERSIIASPTAPTHFDTSSPTASEGLLSQHTPTKHPRDFIEDWTGDRCAEFFTSLGFEQYCDAVIDEEIDGRALVALHHADLKELGIITVGHRLKILKAVYEIKVKQNIPMETGHYIPPSADANAPDAHATQDDIARIIKQIRLRDDRLMACEAELNRFQETLFRFQEEQRKFREDVLPLVRMLKDKNAPLPTPDVLEPPNPLTPPIQADGQSSKLLGAKPGKHAKGFATAKMPSSPAHDNSVAEMTGAAILAATQLTSLGNQSPYLSTQSSPTSPHYAQPGPSSRPIPTSDPAATSAPASSSARAEPPRSRVTPVTLNHPLQSSLTHSGAFSLDPKTLSHDRSDRNRERDKAGGGGGSAADSNETFMKSFRVSMDEPCHKVLPVALRKYNIADDWRQYSLYIVHGDQERCLGLEERPLILFKQLANEGKKPMFMLRKHAGPASARSVDGFVQPGSAGTVVPNAYPGGSLNMGGPGTSSVRQSSATTVHLPGGMM